MNAASTATLVAIDDKETNLRLLRAYLQAEPYRIVTFSDPREALAGIAAERPDVILLDLMMPVLDGFSVLEELKRIAPGVPVVVITALDDRDARLRALAAGARDFLSKPLDRSELSIRVRNLVALKQAADSLEDAHTELQMANRDLQSFAGSLAHDLQQPITTISAFAQVMQSHADELPAGDAMHLQRILAASDSARRMIKGLLEFARLGQAQLSKGPVDLNAVVAEARNIVTAAPGAAAVQWQVAPLPVVQGDASLLLLAFVNLLSNAVKYSQGQPQPRVTVDADSQPHNGHAIRVRDNGVGFDMKHAARLFTPFERLHSSQEFEGTGMGLANVRRILEKHGGSVRADSQPGQGAVFTLLLR